MAVLLLGNGINQKEGLVCPWDNLLKTACSDYLMKRSIITSIPANLAKATGKPDAITEPSICPASTLTNPLPSVDGLTMTLGFDLQEFYAIDHNIAENGTDLKRKIAASMKDRMDEKVNSTNFDWKKTIHWQIMHLPIDTYLTTNYDYALETSVCPDFKSCSGSRETIYSRYRMHTVNIDSNPKTVYHIHGEMHAPKSICLGFEQYSGSLEKMRSDLVRSTRNSEDLSDEHTYHLQDVMLGLKRENGQDEDDGSWYLKFFKEDIYILGLRLDLSEQDIWWLLDFRIRKKKYEKTKFSINNKIYFFDSDSGNRKAKEKYAARNELLKAFGVEIIDLGSASYDAKYKEAIKHILSDLQ